MRIRLGLAALLTFIGTLALISLADGLVIGFHMGFKGLSLEETATEIGKPMLILNEVILLVAALAFIRSVLRAGMNEVGVAPKGLTSNLRLGVSVGVGGWILSGVATAILLWFFPVEVPEWYRRLFSVVGLSDLLVYLFLTWMLIGPCEELFFRGALQNALMRSSGAGVGILITGLLFGLAHFDATLWIRSVGAFIIGVLYGVVYHRRGSLIPCMVAHSVNDTISFALTFIVR
ncbi:MAG: CPBP family intramembrane glutamic endopeptidase [Candidatus Bathyarchaeia archaeon]